MVRLTQADIDSLRSLIGTETQWQNADRVGFYVRYYELIKNYNQSGAFQVLMQAHIASYSGFAGGGALIGNAVAKFSRPDLYTISLDHFSWRIAFKLFQTIETNWNEGGSGILNAEQVITSDNNAWKDEGLLEYFPGLIQQSRMDYVTLFTAGTIGGALSALQLIFGAQVGFTQAERLAHGTLDTTNSDYTLILDAQGRVIWIEEHVGALDASFGVPRFVTDEPGRALVLAMVAAFTFGGPTVLIGGLAVLGSAIAGLTIFNGAAGRAAMAVLEETLKSLWSDSELDYGLRSELLKYLGAAGTEVEPDAQFLNGLTYGNFPIKLRNEGVFNDDGAATILGAYSNAEVRGNGGEDILYGFAWSKSYGGSGDDLLLGKDDASLFGDEGKDTLIAGGRALAYGGADNDALFGFEDSKSHGEGGDDTIFGFQRASLNGGVGNDWLIHFGNGVMHGDDGRDVIITWGAKKNADNTTGMTIYGDADNDVLISLWGDGAYLYGGSGADILVGWSGGEDHLFGNDGASAADGEQDLFFISHRTFVHNAGTEDRVYLGPFRATGGVQTWWMEGQFAYNMPVHGLFSTLPPALLGSAFALAPFLALGALVDAISSLMFRYAISSTGQLVIQSFVGVTQSVVEDYKLDLETGLGTAGIAVYKQNLVEGKGSLAQFEQALNLAFKAGFGIGWGGQDPLVLDLDGDGYDLVRREATNVYFDLDADTFAERTAWVAPDDGFLVRDLNNNGTIDNITEMFGTATTPGLTMLAALDSNGDGRISSADAQFSALRVWRDLDGDGQTDAGELNTLAQSGITQISLTSTSPTTSVVRGNTIRAESTFTRADGTTSRIGDVLLQTLEADTRHLGDNTISAVGNCWETPQQYYFFNCLNWVPATAFYDFEKLEHTPGIEWEEFNVPGLGRWRALGYRGDVKLPVLRRHFEDAILCCAGKPALHTRPSINLGTRLFCRREFYDRCKAEGVTGYIFKPSSVSD